MEYPCETFLNLGSDGYLAVNGTVTSLPVLIQNILNCVPKTNKAFTGSEQHGGREKWQNNNFGVGYPFNVFTDFAKKLTQKINIYFTFVICAGISTFCQICVSNETLI